MLSVSFKNSVVTFEGLENVFAQHSLSSNNKDSQLLLPVQMCSAIRPIYFILFTTPKAR